jgi:hypothetical protein
MLLSQQIKFALQSRKVEQEIAKNRNAPDQDWKLWEPYPIQKKLLDCNASLVGFGGSGGGSKSTAILFASYLRHNKSLIIRKTYPNLKELVERSREMFSGAGGSYNSIDKLWRFGAGKNIEFGALQYEKDKDNYRGREHSGLFVDEVTELPGGWATLQFLMGWMRDPDENQFCQCVVTFNPPSTPEGEWIKEVFAAWIDPEHDNPAESGEVRWFANIDGKDTEVEQTEPFELDGELIEPMSRTFIRATLEDNERLKNTSYRQTLKSLPEPLRSQLLYGDMSLRINDDAWQIIPTSWVEAAFQRWEAMLPPDTKKSPISSIGVDVSRGGNDQTILAIRQGSYFQPIKAYPGTATPDGGAVAAQVVKHYQDGCRVNIDVIGVGASVYDILKNTYPNVYALGNEGSSKTDKSKKLAFLNKRAELYWLLREALDPENGANICLPKDNKLKAELCAPRWSLVPPAANNAGKKGRIKVESKDEIKKRIGRSPDRADAICYSWDNSSGGSSGNSAPVIW